MKKVLLFLTLVMSLTSFSQTNGTILGTVIDKNTEAPLPFVKVFVEGTNYGTSTDFDGSYKLEIPTGTYTLRASFSGYDIVFKYNVELNSGNAQTINFEMSQGNTDLDVVEVTFNDDAVAITTDMVTPLSVQINLRRD